MDVTSARKLAKELIKHLRFKDGKKIPLILVGSVKRGEKSNKDIDIIAVVRDKRQLTSNFLASATINTTNFKVISAGKRRARYKYKGKNIDVFLFTRKELPYALFQYNSSKAYNIRIRAYAKRKGYILNQYGIFRANTGRRAYGTSAIKKEKDIAKFLGVTWRPLR